MSRVAWIIMLAALAAVPADALTAIPDLPGTWNGESESMCWAAEIRTIPRLRRPHRA